MNHKVENENFPLALSATIHCLTGCGLGDIIGVLIGTIFGLPYISRILFGVFFGFLFGFLLSIIPLLHSHISFKTSTRIVLTTETLSILAMECAEAGMELIFPGMRKSGLFAMKYYIGLIVALLFGFIIAFPVNFILVKNGVRHKH